MLPLFGDINAKGRLMSLVAQNAGVCEEDILGSDLFLYNRMSGSIWGADEEFISSPKLDDLQCAFSSLKGFLAGENKDTVQVCVVFDNEEVKSYKTRCRVDFLSRHIKKNQQHYGKR